MLGMPVFRHRLANTSRFIDSDDTYKASHLESRLEFMRTHPEIDIIRRRVFCA